MKNVSSTRLTALGILAAGLLWSVVVPTAAQADYERGLDAFNRGLYDEALHHLEDAADDGHAYSQYLLGRIYGEGLGVEKDPSDAIYWLNCAGTSADSVAGSALRLKDRLSRDLSVKERKAADRSAASCPRVQPVDGVESSLDLFGTPKAGGTPRRRASRLDEGFTGFMQDVRANAVVSFIVLPGEVTVAAGRETASFLGAKQVAYGIDTTRQPGNDLLYMAVVLFSWFLLYKLVRGTCVMWRKFSEVALTIEIHKNGQSSTPRRRPGSHQDSVGGA
jgi:hypothetical protein